MCPPDYFGIEYEINPWMSRSRQCDHQLAETQWNQLHGILKSLDVDIRLMKPVKGLPDLVFTANAGLVFGQRAIVSRFRHPERQPESDLDEQWFQAHGFNTTRMPDQMDFEGAGDALFLSDTLFAGYLIRSDAKAMQWVGDQLDCRVIPMQLVDDRFYHLDTCFCPLDTSTAMYFPPAFDQYAQQALEELVPNLIPVEPDEAVHFACNAVVVEKHVVLSTGCPKLEARLRDHGFETHATELTEFIKAGGSAKCLTLRLDGEQAAAWREVRGE